MATAACGIDCTVCLLHVRGLCSSCGAGTSLAGREKLEAQRRILGAGCGILECAVRRGIGHCLRDCAEFPCAEFSGGPYPFAAGFLEMQRRRREGLVGNVAHWPENAALFWEMLEARPPEEVRRCSGATGDASRFTVLCLDERWTVDAVARTVDKESGGFGGEWDRQLPFLLLAYLTKAAEAPLSGDMVAPRELVGGQDMFQGRNAIDTSDLVRAFGTDPDGVLRALTALGGRKTEHADASATLSVFPKLPVELLLWRADEEFPARVAVLLDRRTPDHYPVEGIASCVNLLVRRVLLAAR